MKEHEIRNSYLDQMERLLQRIASHDTQFQPRGSEEARAKSLARLGQRIRDTRL